MRGEHAVSRPSGVLLQLACGHQVRGARVSGDPFRLAGAWTPCERCGAMRVIDRVVVSVPQRLSG